MPELLISASVLPQPQPKGLCRAIPREVRGWDPGSSCPGGCLEDNPEIGNLLPVCVKLGQEVESRLPGCIPALLPIVLATTQ